VIGRRLLVGLIVLLVAAPVTFVGFAMALVVVELVIFPTVTLVIAVVTALVASWAADGLAGDGLHTDLDQTVSRNLVWALVPAALAVLSIFVPPTGPFLLLLVVIWLVVAATALAFRHRRAKTSTGRRLTQSGVWLFGTGLATAVVIFVASLFGLTGA
jgi:hypothetical protein